MLGVYNYTVILTYIGMLTGFTGITCAIHNDLKGALICLMIAGVCDMFDGKIASTMERTREEERFGIQIDSFSDLICFGVLPAVLIFTTGSTNWILVPTMLYVLCALIRLAWFNVDEEMRQDEEGGCRTIYYGLPVTTAALIVPVVICLCAKENWMINRLSSVVMVITAIAFLTPFQIKKPGLPGKIGIIVLGVCGLLFVLSTGMSI